MARNALRLAVVSEGAEYLVMGYLMRRNILAYKAPPGNEGYDLICIHPDPRYQPGPGEHAQVRVQVKSRYQTDCDRGFPIKEKSLDAFDFLVVAFLNIGKFFGGNDGSSGAAPPAFYTLAPDFIREHHDASTTWQKVKLRGMEEQIAPFRDEAGFELIAKALGIPAPRRLAAGAPKPTTSAGCDEPADRLARVLATLAVERKVQLDELKAEAVTLERDDAIWHMLLGAFSTLGSSRGWDGLIGNADNYNRVTFDAIARLSPHERVPELKAVLLAALVRYPAKKGTEPNANKFA